MYSPICTLLIAAVDVNNNSFHLSGALYKMVFQCGAIKPRLCSVPTRPTIALMVLWRHDELQQNKPHVEEARLDSIRLNSNCVGTCILLIPFDHRHGQCRSLPTAAAAAAADVAKVLQPRRQQISIIYGCKFSSDVRSCTLCMCNTPIHSSESRRRRRRIGGEMCVCVCVVSYKRT